MPRAGFPLPTLLNIIAGLEPADAGTASFLDVDMGALNDDARTLLRRDRFGFVFQAFHVLPHLTVEQNVAFVKKLGDRVAVMDDGRIVHAGTMAEFAADAALQSRLLGLAMEAHA